MNPTTRATNEEIRAICAKHDIPYSSHTRITTGFSHELHRINDDFVIKIFNNKDTENDQRFKTESALLASNAPFLKPKLIAYNGDKDLIDRDYVIMTYVEGSSLGSKWHQASNEQREELIAAISLSLRAINNLKPEDIDLEKREAWRDTIKKRGERHISGLQNKGIIDAVMARRIRQTFDRDIAVFDKSPLRPVYWDIHFDNFIVDNNFKLQALIDLENVELTSLDYPLFVIQKLMDEPKQYLSEENERYANKKDYENLKNWYKKYYPEMFAFDNLDTRVKIYQLLDTLHLLVDWSHVKSLHVKLDELLS